MISIFVTIQIKSAFNERFREASLGDAQGSVKDEPGCYRFDILQANTNLNRWYLYEVYSDEAALEAHRNAPHYKKWLETVQDWFDGEPQRIVMTTIFPSDDGWQRQKPHLLDW